MIDLYFAPTPNGWKISIMLEECGLPYQVKWVNIGAGEQFEPEFLAISPNTRIPAIVDNEPLGSGQPHSIFETGAILVYLAEKTGSFLPFDPVGRSKVRQWLMWQMSGLGPMLGQHGHFKLYAPEKIPYAIDRYRREAERLFGVLDRQLATYAGVNLATASTHVRAAAGGLVVGTLRRGTEEVDVTIRFPDAGNGDRTKEIDLLKSILIPNNRGG